MTISEEPLTSFGAPGGGGPPPFPSIWIEPMSVPSGFKNVRSHEAPLGAEVISAILVPGANVELRDPP